MAYKPMEEREYRHLIKLVGWSLEKSGFDYLDFASFYGSISLERAP